LWEANVLVLSDIWFDEESAVTEAQKLNASSAQPLDEVWWVRKRASFPQEDLPILAPYGKTRPGYELGRIEAIAKGPMPADAGDFREVGDGYYEVCLWNIWHKGEDPATKDEQKQKLNEMQRALGPLDDDTRLVRLQIACFERCNDTFPLNVDLILDGIAKGRPNLDGSVSCEPPLACSIIPILRHRRGENPRPADGLRAAFELHREEREKLFRAYATILDWWTFGGDLGHLKAELPEHADLAETIYRRLGPPTKLKALYVQKVRASVACEAFPRGAGPDGARHLMETCDAAIQAELAGKPDLIGKMIGAVDTCHHALFRRIDRQLANIGAGQVVPLPGAGGERKRIYREITNYVHALGSWLVGRTPAEAAEIWPDSEQTVTRVYAVLGDPVPKKRWLAACLWKQLQDNQAHHGRGPLNDQPERFAIPLSALSI
jgi:hypothetical protein